MKINRRSMLFGSVAAFAGGCFGLRQKKDRSVDMVRPGHLGLVPEKLLFRLTVGPGSSDWSVEPVRWHAQTIGDVIYSPQEVPSAFNLWRVLAYPDEGFFGAVVVEPIGWVLDLQGAIVLLRREVETPFEGIVVGSWRSAAQCWHWNVRSLDGRWEGSVLSFAIGPGIVGQRVTVDRHSQGGLFIKACKCFPGPSSSCSFSRARSFQI